MPRVKRGTVRRAKRKKLLGLAKGYYANKSKLYRAAKESVDTALKYAFVGRRRKKRDFRRLWVVRINAAAREHGLTYGQMINGLKNAGITLDRKSLSELAISSPAAFATLAKQAKAAAKIAVKSAKNAEKAVASKAANAKSRGARITTGTRGWGLGLASRGCLFQPQAPSLQSRVMSDLPPSAESVETLVAAFERELAAAVVHRRRQVAPRPLPRTQEQHRRVLDAADWRRARPTRRKTSASTPTR